MKNKFSALGTRSTQELTFKDHINRLRICENMLRNLPKNASNEGIGQIATSAFIDVADTFLRVANTFKTNVFKFYRETKRSEIKFYSESHMLKIKQVEAVPFTTIMNVQIDIPSGCGLSYKSMVDDLGNIYNTISTYDFLKGLIKSLNKARIDIARENVNFDSLLTAEMNIVNKKNEELSKVVGSYLFTDLAKNERTTTDAFKNRFDSMAEFKQVRLTLEDYDKYITATSSYVTLLEEADRTIGGIAEYIKINPNVDKEFILRLASITRYLASAFDLYGETIKIQMAVEHNYIKVIEKIRETINNG